MNEPSATIDPIRPTRELPPEAVKELSGCRMFRDASPEAVSELEAICTWYWCRAGGKIFDRMDPRTDVFFLVQGAARVVDHARSGQEVAFTDIPAGEIFGELSAIDHEPRSATVYTLEDSLLATVPAEAFTGYLVRHPPVMLDLLRHFVSSIRHLNSRVVGLSSMTGVQRVYGELLKMAEPDPAGGGRWLIQYMPSHADIAIWAGTTPETVAHAIGQLLRAEVAKRRHKTLHIMDRQRLQELMSAS
jgi:CRP/FNR family cyclic AMP-dependent transcriptional regulator